MSRVVRMFRRSLAVVMLSSWYCSVDFLPARRFRALSACRPGTVENPLPHRLATSDEQVPHRRPSAIHSTRPIARARATCRKTFNESVFPFLSPCPPVDIWVFSRRTACRILYSCLRIAFVCRFDRRIHPFRRPSMISDGPEPDFRLSALQIRRARATSGNFTNPPIP